MKKHKIAAAFICVVFVTAAWGAMAAGQRPLPGPGFGVPPPYEGWEPWHKVPEPPSNGAGAGVPEPGSLVLLIGGGLGLLGWAWRKRRRR